MPVKLQLQLAGIGNFRRIGIRLRQMRKQQGHFRGSFQIKLIGMHFKPVFVIHRFTRTHANEHVLHLCVLLAQVMCVIGDHKLRPDFPGQLDELRIHFLLLGDAMVLKLQVKILAKRRLIPECGFFRFLIMASQQMERDLSA
ncbi:hypothetical protein D3C81_1480610 [compost metagenome]